MNTRRWKLSEGFTLLEILVAVAILAMALVVILDLHSGAMIASRRAEDVTTATMLARQKIHEVQLDIEKDMSKGEYPSENNEIEGSFDEPFEDYKWKATIKKVDIPVPPAAPEGEENQNADMMLTMFKLISEKISGAAREVSVEVFWNELGEEQSLSVTTHIVKL